MAAKPKTAVKIVLGAMTLGEKGAEQARVHTLEECTEILDVFQKHGHNEVDTAIVYGGGSSEKFLGQLHWQDRGIIMDTKFAPNSSVLGPGIVATHSPEHLREALKRSLASLQTDKVDMWYLHSPDRSTPYETTLREVNNLHKEGYFKRFGISNYMAWEVAQMCEICDRNGWIKPTVYQGVYNALHRAVEPDLFSCLRHYGLSFYEYNPLAGGYLTSKYDRNTLNNVEEGSRFDPNRNQGKMYRRRYWNDAYFDALDILRPVAKKHGLSEAECALRWIANHSLLSKEHGDAIIIGASSAAQLEENLTNLEKGPLPEEILKAFDEGWQRVKGTCDNYFR
ncbi:NADP-dependent oxidoreductase domain-containing protein [Xylogone sp. PMI_703]|nr:NADP-dependent oxidoreductase domain-containing protein [Xylogone sp. PMI_703]